jgi:hypothetical protein
MIAVVRLNSQPIRRVNHHQNLDAGRERLDRGCSVKRGRLERGSGLFHYAHDLATEIRNVLFERLAGEFVGE